MSVSKTVSDIIAPLREKRDQLQAEIDNLVAEIAPIKEEIAVIDRILKAANHGPDDSKQRPKTAIKSTGKKSQDIKGTPKTVERSKRILDLMKRHPEQEDWKASEVARELNLTISAVNVTLTYMRQEDMVRATRRVQGGGFAYAPWK